MSEKKNKSLRRQEDVRLLDEEVFEEFEDEEDFSESDNFSADDSFDDDDIDDDELYEDEDEEEEKDCTDPIADALRNILNEQEERFREGHDFITQRFNKTV